MNIPKSAFKTLKAFYKNISMPKEDLGKLSPEDISILENNELIAKDFLGYLDGQHRSYTLYHITDAGKAYIQNHSPLEWLRQNWLSLLSMVFAFIAAIPVIWKGIVYILQHIV